MKKKSFWGKQLRAFRQSFTTFNLKFIYILLIDLLFYAGLYLSYALFQKLLYVKFNALENAKSSLVQISQGNLAEGMPFMHIAQDLIIKVIIGAFLLLLFWIIIHTITRGIIWHFIDGRKMNLKYFTGFFKLNLLWFVVIFIILTILSIILVKTIFMYSLILILFPLYLYFTTILHAKLDKKTAWKQIKLTSGFGFRKIGHVILPLIILYIVLGLWNGLLILISMFLGMNLYYLFFVILFILYMTWLRNYLYCLIKQLEH